MPTLIFPISRIEGHAQVVIDTHGCEVISAHFQATEFRGFDYFVQGIPAEQMPVIVPRICGVCSTAHLVCSVKALESLYGITPPPLARRIRELLLLGQLIQNQATSLFIFTMPDRLGTDSIFEAESRNTTIHPPLAIQSLQVRKAGSDLITLAGGQFIHPVKAIIGGVTGGIPRQAAEEMRAKLQLILPVACELFDHYWQTSLEMVERIGTWGDDQPSHYIASTGRSCMNFDSAQFQEKLTFVESSFSYSDETTYNGEIMRANSLARINLSLEMGTPLADQYLQKFQKTFGKPAHAIMLFDLSRGIELVYALERAIEILSTSLDGAETSVSFTPRDGEGFGLVEAPRGPLIHHYTVENGVINKVKFIIPTVHNMQAISRALKVAAKRYVADDHIDLELEKAVGRVVRAFDPCIACATH
jgi:F420-non-reducing hydrogenase large subunit